MDYDYFERPSRKQNYMTTIHPIGIVETGGNKRLQFTLSLDAVLFEQRRLARL